MKKQIIAICILCFTAVLLLVAALAPADFAIRDTNYQLITLTGQQGSSTVFVIDVRAGRLAVFTPDIRNPGRYQLGKIEDMTDFFAVGR